MKYRQIVVKLTFSKITHFYCEPNWDFIKIGPLYPVKSKMQFKNSLQNNKSKKYTVIL